MENDSGVASHVFTQSCPTCGAQSGVECIPWIWNVLIHKSQSLPFDGAHESRKKKAAEAVTKRLSGSEAKEPLFQFGFSDWKTRKVLPKPKFQPNPKDIWL